MGSETKEERNTAEYLAQLLKDKKQVQAFPNVFIHLDRLLDDEINKVRVSLFHLEKKPLVLPDPSDGDRITLTEKLYVPVREHPDFNFVGRILGPRGITAKQLERDTGCKIMVRGKGSMRDKKKEDQMRGKPNWEHLGEDLHVLIVVEDAENRAAIKMARALEEVKKLLVPAPEGEDDLKKIQLMELAIMNGTYRDTKVMAAAQQAAAVQQAVAAAAAASSATALPAGFPYIAAADHQAQLHAEMQQRALAAAAAAGAPLGLSAASGLQATAGLRAAAAAAAAAGTPIILSPQQHHRVISHQQQLQQQQHQLQQLQQQHHQLQQQHHHQLQPQRLRHAANLAAAAAAAHPPPLVSPGATASPGESGFYYTLPSTEFAQFATFPAASMFDYHGLDLSTAGAIPKMRRHQAAAHPYQRL